MRVLPAIIVLSIAYACAKPKTKDPVPHIEFLDFIDPRKSVFTGSDTATMHLSYEDGDGDLFVNNYSDGPNMVFTTYYYNEKTKSFEAEFSPAINDTIRNSTTIKQPDNGYYKGKSIRGEIFVPLTSFRSDNTKKVLKFAGFIQDMAGNKSNTFSSPSYTLNF